MTSSTEGIPAGRRKPRVAFAIATALGLGFAPKAPGTFGAAGGVLLCTGTVWLCGVLSNSPLGWTVAALFAELIAVAVAGVWSASAVARFTGRKDPQIAVIDEVSGQQVTYLLALAILCIAGQRNGAVATPSFAHLVAAQLLNWKFLLLGFVLFRVFDITKPFPCRGLERLPAGWGIMADDWMAGIYAAILLWLALHFSLL